MTLPNVFATRPGGNTPSALLDQNFSVLEQGLIQPVLTTGSVNTYVLVPVDPWLVGYSAYAGTPLSVIFNVSNSGPSSAQVSSLGAVQIVKNVGGAAGPLVAGDIVAGIPYVLICDGSQLWLQGSGSSGSSSTKIPPGVGNFKWGNNTTTPNSQITVTADWASTINSTTGISFYSTGISATLNLATTGANGLDTGVVAASTGYFGYIIAGASGVATLASISATNPAMPTGYTTWFRCFAFSTDSSSNLYKYNGHMRDVQVKVTSSTNTASMFLLASGSAGNVSTPTWVAVSTVAFVPTTAASIKITITTGAATTNIMVAPNSSYGAQSSTTNPPIQGATTVSGYAPAPANFSMSLETSSIYWASSGGYMFCSGWVDNW